MMIFRSLLWLLFFGFIFCNELGHDENEFAEFEVLDEDLGNLRAQQAQHKKQREHQAHLQQQANEESAREKQQQAQFAKERIQDREIDDADLEHRYKNAEDSEGRRDSADKRDKWEDIDTSTKPSPNVDLDDFSHFHDPDEFEGYEKDRPSGGGFPPDGEGVTNNKQGEDGDEDVASRSSGKGRGKGEEPSLKIVNVPYHLTTSWENFYLEALMLFGLGVYLLNFLFGKTKNASLAQAWFSSHLRILESNFSLVGDDGTTKDLPPASSEACENSDDEGSSLVTNSNKTSGVRLLSKEAEHLYSLWCSGRSSCEGMLVELKFIKRQDLIQTISSLVKPVDDTITIKITLDEGEVDTYVLCLAHRKKATSLVKDNLDLATFCKEKKSVNKYGFSGDQFVLLSEISEAAEAVFSDHRIIATLKKFEDSIEYLLISDQYSGTKPSTDENQATKVPETKNTLILSFKVGKRGVTSVSDMERSKPLMELAMYMTDKIKRIKLGKEAKLKAEKNRRKASETYLKMVHSHLQEAAQARREEKRRVEKERLLNEDDPEKARRLEAIDQKKELKRKQPKTKMLKVKSK